MPRFRGPLSAMKPNVAERLLTVREAAERVGVAEDTVRLWLRLERLPKVVFGRRSVRVTESALAEFVTRRTVPRKGEG
jgi:excisionase family DNA binding protein